MILPNLPRTPKADLDRRRPPVLDLDLLIVPNHVHDLDQHQTRQNHDQDPVLVQSLVRNRGLGHARVLDRSLGRNRVRFPDLAADLNQVQGKVANHFSEIH